MSQAILEEIDTRADGRPGLRRAVFHRPAGRRTLRVALLGLGNVGQGVLRVASRQRERLAAAGLDVQIVAALVRDTSRPRGPHTAELRISSEIEDVLRTRPDVAIEVLGGVEPARRIVERCLRAGVPVITANKSLLAAHGPRLRAIAQRFGASLRGEAAAVAGVPFLETLRARPLASSVRRISGILNGTSNYIVDQIASRGCTIDEALARAVELGLAEPDASADLSGRDAAEKLAVILQHLSVQDLRLDALERTGLDALLPVDVRHAAALGGRIRPVVDLTLAGDTAAGFVGPAFVPLTNPLAHVPREQNLLHLVGEDGGELLFGGTGAGPDVTAATLLDDVVEVVRGGRERREEGLRLPAVRLRSLGEARTAWVLRFCFAERRTPYTTVPALLEPHGLEVRQLVGAPPQRCGDVLYAVVGVAERKRVEAALASVEVRTGARTLAIRVLESARCLAAQAG